jgi:cell division inhibitor SulA/protein ImuA
MSLQPLFERASIWRGGELPAAVGDGIPTGYPLLDGLLPGGGWPRAALSEILAPEGAGALSLLMPALSALSREDRWLAMVAPPLQIYAPALAAHGIDLSRLLCIRPGSEREHLWALEQALRSGACAAVLSWFARPPVTHLRRLQLAATSGDCAVFLFYPPQKEAQSTPAALRLSLAPGRTGPQVRILKRRGGWPCGPVSLEPNHPDHAVARTTPAAAAAGSAYPRQRAAGAFGRH